MSEGEHHTVLLRIDIPRDVRSDLYLSCGGPQSWEGSGELFRSAFYSRIGTGTRESLL